MECDTKASFKTIGENCVKEKGDLLTIYRDSIEEKCKIFERQQNEEAIFPWYVMNIKCSTQSKIFGELSEHFSVCKNARLWLLWLKKKHQMPYFKAQKIITRYKHKIPKKYLKWWNKVETNQQVIYFSEKMMKDNFGLQLKSIKNIQSECTCGTSCDVSHLLTKSYEKKRIFLSPGNLKLRVDIINFKEIPPFPNDENFESSAARKHLGTNSILLRKVKPNNFQFMVQCAPLENKIFRSLHSESRVCGIDLGVIHFATIFDPQYGVIFVDVNTGGIFQRKNPSHTQIKKFDKYIEQFQDNLVNYLLNKYALIVIGNLCIEDDDYQKHCSLAKKMEHFQYTRFRNTLIRKAFPRNETGSTVIVIDEYRTSRTCSRCRYHDSKCKFDGSTFLCKKCNYRTNKDINAAKNILKKILTTKKTKNVLQCS